MHTPSLLFGLAAIASTSVNALATPGMSLAKRHTFNTEGDCSPQPLGSGPVPTPDTDTAFLNDPDLSNIATQAVTPAGWALVYQDLQAASTDSGYIAYEEITSYDPGYCASQCCNFWTGCTSFNIYFERDPVVDPGANCTNPASTTRIKCSYWSVDLTQGDATNDGQYCQDFHVVIAGSNAYKGGCPNHGTSSSTIVSSTSSTTPSTTSVTTSVTTSTLMTTTKSTTTSTTTKASTTTSKAAATTTAASNNWSSWQQPGPPAPPAPPAKPAPPAPPAPPAKPAPPAPPAPPAGPAPPAKPAPPAGPAPPAPAPPAKPATPAPPAPLAPPAAPAQPAYRPWTS